jgi:hypothetical protein
MKPSAPSYLERPADRELFEFLSAGEFCYVLTSRQMGKSSLMARTAARLREGGTLAAVVDLTLLSGSGAKDQPPSAAAWYLGIARVIAGDLQLKADLRTWWQQRDGLPEMQRFAEFLEEVVLAETAGKRLVVFVDEIDATLRLPFTDDFFAGIRACYNARATKPAFERLTFALLGVASPDELIKDASRTPFNIGRRIGLIDFMLDQAAPLAAGLPLNPADARLALERVLHWTGGQPYLTQKLCLELSRRLAAPVGQTFLSAGSGDIPVARKIAGLESPANRQAGMPALPAPPTPASTHDQSLLTPVATADDLVQALLFSPEGLRDEVHFKYIRDRVLKDPRRRVVLRTYGRVLDGQPPQDNPQSLAQNVLKLAGLIRRTPDGTLATRNRIYDRLFNRDWVRQALATDPTRRRAFAVGLVTMLLVAAPIAYWLWDSAQKARVQALADVLLKTRPDAVSDALAKLKPWQRRAAPLLLTAFTISPAGSPEKFQAALGLASFGDVRVSFLVKSAAQGLPGQSLNIIRALQPQRTAALAEIQRIMTLQPSPDARARLATLALALEDLQPLAALTAKNPDPPTEPPSSTVISNGRSTRGSWRKSSGPIARTPGWRTFAPRCVRRWR